MKKNIINILIIAFTAIALFLLVFFTNGIDELLDILVNMKHYWIAVAFGCMLVYWLSDALILYLLSKGLFEKQRLLNTLKITMVGQFFNAVTPFATGGQPAQAYVMVKDGISVGHAASVLIIRSILYQVILAIYTLLVVILKASFFISKIPHFFAMYIVGFLLNMTVITLYILFVFNRAAAHKIIMGLFQWLKKFRFLKKLEKYQHKLETELESFSQGAVVVKNNLGLVLKTVMIQIAQLTFYFSIPYFIFLAVETREVNAWDMIGVQAIVTMITLLIPSPGASGGAEGTGYLFFSMFFRANLVIPVILLWRIITYYSSLAFGGLVTVLAPERPLKKMDPGSG